MALYKQGLHCWSIQLKTWTAQQHSVGLQCRITKKSFNCLRA